MIPRFPGVFGEVELAVATMPRRTAPRLVLATPHEAEGIARQRNTVADEFTKRHSRGWWSRQSSGRGVLFEMRISKVYVYRRRGEIVATLRLASKKPWAIDTAYFIPVERALFLHSIAVLPAHQRMGIGTRCLKAAEKFARAWPANAIRLDAFDHAASAGDFYCRAGFRQVGRTTYRGVRLIYFERLV